MDPVTVLTVVGNAVQLAELGIKVISQNKVIYSSGTGTIAENDDIELLAADLQHLSTKLSDSISPTGVLTAHTDDDQALLEICSGCIEISNELCQALEKIKTKGDLTRWKSIRSALKSTWKTEHIAALETRLSKYHSQLHTRLLHRLCSNIDLAELKRSEDYAQLDESIKLLVDQGSQSAEDLKRTVFQYNTSLGEKVSDISPNLWDQLSFFT